MEENNKQPIPKPSNNKVVETYAEDMAEAIAHDHGGLVKKLIHEEEDKEQEQKNISPESKRNKLFALVGSILLLCSVALVLFLFLNNKPRSVDVEMPFTSIIFNDTTSFIEITDLDKNKIIQRVRKEVENKEIKKGGLGGMYLTLNNNFVGLREFVTLMKMNFVIEQNEFVDDNFLMGFVDLGAVEEESSIRDFFILIRMRSFTDIFEAVRVWEDKMFNDLYGLFGYSLSPEIAPLLVKDFENGIVQNKNARIVYQTDAEGNNTVAMMYAFVDDSHLVITTSEEVVREIITRLLGNNLRN